jgi:hypothetical protein
MLTNEIQMTLKGNHLIVRMAGKPRLEIMQRQTEKMLETCVDHHCDKVLINATKTTGLLSVLDLYQWGNTFDKIWNRNIRIAVVAPVEKLAEHRFFETVARNRGVLIQTFVRVKEASDWLDSNAS